MTAARASAGRTERRGRRRFLALLAVGVVALAACGGGDDDSAAEPANAPADEPAAEESAMESSTDADLVATDDGSTPIDLGTIGRDVIVEMHVVMSSDDIGRSVASITATASQLGGGIASSTVDYGDRTNPDAQGYAVLVVKVPPTAIDRLLSGLDATGTVRSIEQSAQDVTEQLVDLDIRIENARESVANVRRFMDQTENLDDLVRLEAELTRRQTQLEQLEAQQRNLTERVALSTITIEVVPTASVPPPADDDTSIGGALRDGWHAFNQFVHAIAYMIAVLLPFLVLGAIAALTAIWIVNRRRRAAEPVSPPPASSPASPPPASSPPTPPTVVGEDPVDDAAVGEGEGSA